MTFYPQCPSIIVTDKWENRMTILSRKEKNSVMTVESAFTGEGKKSVQKNEDTDQDIDAQLRQHIEHQIAYGQHIES